MILSNRKTRKSARILKEKLEQLNYTGTINFGCSSLTTPYTDILNKPEAVANAVNKYKALQIMEEADIQTPLITESEAQRAVLRGDKVVGRKTYHSKGKGMYMCYTSLGRAKRLGATHWLKYIEDAREFRVHIINGDSIKISEKFFPEGTIRRNHRFGGIFAYPHSFHHKKSLRRIAKEAVECLGLDFGAVDILWKDEEFYVLEVNTAPCLTDENSDTLDKYVAAFCS